MKINDRNNSASNQTNKGSSKRAGRNKDRFSLSLYLNGQSDQVTVKIIDNNTKETECELSSQELHDIHDKIRKMAVNFLDQKEQK